MVSISRPTRCANQPTAGAAGVLDGVGEHTYSGVLINLLQVRQVCLMVSVSRPTQV